MSEKTNQYLFKSGLLLGCGLTLIFFAIFVYGFFKSDVEPILGQVKPAVEPLYSLTHSTYYERIMEVIKTISSDYYNTLNKIYSISAQLYQMQTITSLLPVFLLLLSIFGASLSLLGFYYKKKLITMPTEQSTVKSAGLSFCPKCGKQISSEWDYCVYCGAKMK